MIINSYGPIIPSLQGATRVIGNWNAATNTPFLQDGVGTVGDTYIVNVAGTQNLGHGSEDYNVGDQVYYTTGGIWEVIPAGNTVVSVNGKQGIVVLNLGDLNDVPIATPLDRQALVYNSSNQTWINSTLQPADVQLGNVQNVDTTNQANVTIQGAFTPENNPIITADSGLDIAQKAQGQINAINVTLNNYGVAISFLQNNAIQSINGATDLTALNLINGINTTISQNIVDDEITLAVNVANATTSIIGATRTATQIEANDNTEPFAYITPQTLNNSTLASNVATNTINITNLQTNAIQSISYSGGTFTGNNQLSFIDSSTITWNLVDSGNITQATATAVTATTSVLGVSRPNGTQLLIAGGVLSIAQSTESLIAGIAVATQTQTNAGTLDSVAITPLKLANSTLASTVVSNTINITNLQANAIQTINTISNNNILIIRNSAGTNIPTADVGTTTQITFPDAAVGTSGLAQIDGISNQYSNVTANNKQICSPYGMGRNYLINGDFTIAQSGISANITTQTKTFVCDRWYTDTQTGAFVGTIVASRAIQNPIGTQVNTPEPAPYYIFLNQISAYTSGQAYFIQTIENVNNFSNEYVTITCWIFVNLVSTLQIDLVQNFGTGGAPSANVIIPVATIAGGNAVSLPANNWLKITRTVLVPSVNNKTLGTNFDSCLAIRFYLPPAALFCYFGNIQLEKGQISTPFDKVLASTQQYNCNKYCYIGTSFYEAQVVGTNTYSYQINFPVQMRAAPLVVSSTNNGAVNFSPVVGGLTTNTAAYCVDTRTAAAGLGAKGSFSTRYILRAEITI